MIAVMDYGAGNVRSVMHALEYIGEKSLLTRNAGEILSADAGHSSGRGRVWRCDGAAARQRCRAGDGGVYRLRQTVPRHLYRGTAALLSPVRKRPARRAFCWLRGQVKRIPSGEGRKIPHMGWNQLNIMKDDPLFSGLPEKPWMYFVHSYFCSRFAARSSAGTGGLRRADGCRRAQRQPLGRAVSSGKEW